MSMFTVIVLWCLFIVHINGDFSVVHLSPMTTLLSTTNPFICEINQTVNRPLFSTYVHIFNATSNSSISQIDVHNTTTNVTYLNNTLTFYLPATISFNVNDIFYITFDQGVLFSNPSVNSSARSDTTFWSLRVTASDTTTSATITSDHSATIQTTFTSMSYTSVHNSDTTAVLNTTIVTTQVTGTQAMLNSTGAVDTSGNFIPGEPPPTRSAQLGMGLGIIFITLLIIGEILYFKYCYNGDGRSGSYYT